MTWLAWRQLRANAAVAAVATLAVVALLAATRQHIAEVAGTDALSSAYESMRLLGTGLIGAPAFIGAFWGAPMLARELEAGTHRLAWTQSVCRRRWLLTKLGLSALAAALLVGVLSVLFTWWSAPFDELGNRIGTANFGQRGIVPVAYALFALALGTFAGTILRRTLPAMAATLVAFFVVRFAVQLVVRPRLLAPVVRSLPNNSFGQRDEQLGGMGAWILSSRTVDGSGRTLAASEVDRLLADACRLTRDSTRSDWVACVDRLGIHDIARLHPDDHFWALQLWESAVFLALGAALVGACLWWLRHRLA